MRVSRGLAIAACAALVAALTGCGGDKAAGDTSTPTQVRLYGTDGNMSNSFGEEFKEEPGTLAGMKGTTPMTQLSEDFKHRLHQVRPDLNDYTYAGESYDAVVISALAAQLAGTTKPPQIAKYINGVTQGGERCDAVAQCLTLARAGRDIEYRGVSLTRAGFTPAGEPSTATYATLHFGRDDRLDDGKTEFLGAGDAAGAAGGKGPAPAKGSPGRSGAPLKIGGLLPQTGDLSLMYPPMSTAAELAIKEINAAGGVLGEKVVWLPGDDGTNPEVARATVSRQIDEGVHVLIGAGASSISKAVLDQTVAAGVVLFSPCNTAAFLSTAQDDGLYFRTAPSDNLQGKALADVMMRDGVRKITIVARDDDYGKGLQANVASELGNVGITPDQIKQVTYTPPEDSKTPLDFFSAAGDIKDWGPDAVLVIGFAESAQVIKALTRAGISLQH
ncbi:ABC transporter substrate-binding protein [Rhizomonospora bruguierae]|uniref:ABC transporter substrate-binding protein n=1 Tax=Rhizomonospora bruguierae TaxID=1581705 RepID=UPI001BCE8F1B|nr:ABC transporter substrate-binding protein [Micromonospora sp. NBRC 107566]